MSVRILIILMCTFFQLYERFLVCNSRVTIVSVGIRTSLNSNQQPRPRLPLVERIHRLSEDRSILRLKA